MNQNQRPYKISKLLVNFLIAFVLLFSSVQTAYAASYAMHSQGDCSGSTPKGSSNFSWSGYPSSAWGKTWGYLWRWSGSSWVLKSQAYSDYTGGTGSNVARTVAGYQSGSWQQTGAHQASFFSGQKNTYGNTFTC